MTATPEDLAHALLKMIVIDRRNKAGDHMRALPLQIDFLEQHHDGEFQIALGYANEKGWIEPGRQPGFIRLNETGCGEIMNLGWACKDIISIEKKDGTVIPGVKAQIGDGKFILPNDKVAVESGDVILRQIPNGPVERLVVTSPGYHAPNIGFPGHYQGRFQHEHTMQQSRPLNIQVTGHNSRVNYNSVDHSTNTVHHESDLDLVVLTEELAKLRQAILQNNPTAPEQFAALTKIAEAEASAKNNNQAGVTDALASVGKVAGKWLRDVAIDVSAKTAAELISKYTNAA